MVFGFNVTCGIWGEDIKIDKCKETQGSSKMQVNSNINKKKIYSQNILTCHIQLQSNLSITRYHLATKNSKFKKGYKIKKSSLSNLT